MRTAFWLCLALGTSGCTLLAEAALDEDNGGDASAVSGSGASSSSSAATTGGSGGSVGGAGPGSSSGPGPGPGGMGPAAGGAAGAGGSEPCGGCEVGYVCDGSSCQCQAPPTVPAAACPAPCTSCDLAGGLCTIALTGDHKKQNIQCPSGMACRFECGAMKGCEEAKLRCPADQGCEVVCGDADSCKNATMFGGDGGITLQCNGPSSCKDADLKCGEGACLHPCPTGMDGPLKVSCVSSCSCQGCAP